MVAARGLLAVLFEARFVEANFLLAPQLLSDWLKFLTWVLLFLLTAQARVGQYVAVQAVSALVLAVLLALLLPTYGLLGAPLAQAARYGLLLAWCLWFFRRELSH
ncbi:hypothetical protein MUN84_21280 [Hymenobacter sp. 5516J-16]|uniref:hypothetical protein n=1 Tax=Hymenobacter sp. 5516J-16 TaxID=2932253 RepID=UPI001FD42B57|nr:hypothetical protein [Hymenobacter sp. 5516J-16]UOQ76976.1 hypothetical protein MUN84_21280 [Hymenobacter sp. 5516J-16]